MMKKDKINIELSHLDNTTKKTLSYFFNSNLCKFGKLTPDQNITELYVVDYFGIINTDFLNKLKNNNRYAIVLHQNGDLIEEGENLLLLQKPLDPIKLNKLIETIYQKIHTLDSSIDNKNVKVADKNIKIQIVNDSEHNHLFNAVQNKKNSKSVTQSDKEEIHLRFKAQKFVGSNKDVDSNDIQNTKLYLTEKKYIYYYLKKAIEMAHSNKSDIKLSTFSDDIYYDRKNDKFIHNLKPTKLKFIQTAPLSAKTKLLFINNINLIDSKYRQTIDSTEFIWSSAIIASRGRVPNDLNINMSVDMKSWPNFSKLQIFRYAIQISALWSKNKLSLLQTAKLLKIPQRYVFTLFCAMNSLGYAGLVSDNIESSHSIPAKNKSSSLFNKILSHIFKS